MNRNAGDVGLVDHPDCVGDGLLTVCRGVKPDVSTEHFGDPQHGFGLGDPPLLNPEH